MLAIQAVQACRNGSTQDALQEGSRIRDSIISLPKAQEQKTVAEILGIEQEDKEGIHQCRKCGSRQCSTFALQTRRTDEGTTVYITCKECNHRWRENS